MAEPVGRKVAKMKFISMSGAKLLELLHPDEYPHDELRREGVSETSQVRINRLGDIEVLRDGEWEVIGGLLGDFVQRIEAKTGLRWSDG